MDTAYRTIGISNNTRDMGWLTKIIREPSDDICYAARIRNEKVMGIICFQIWADSAGPGSRHSKITRRHGRAFLCVSKYCFLKNRFLDTQFHVLYPVFTVGKGKTV